MKKPDEYKIIYNAMHGGIDFTMSPISLDNARKDSGS